MSALFAFALGIRLLHVWQIRTAPFFSLYLGDTRGYHEWGQRIAAGDWLGDTVFYQAPLYPYFLGTLYAVFGTERWLVLSFQAVLGAASCVLLARAGRHFVSPSAGLAAGALLAVYAPAIFFDGLLQKSALDLFFLCLALWLTSQLTTTVTTTATKTAMTTATKTATVPLWIGLGAAIGALVLTRENALVLAAAILVWIQASPRHRGMKATAGFLLGLALLLVPVAWRNYAVGGEFHLTTSQLGPNLYIGNRRDATGVYQPLRLGRGSYEYERNDAKELAERSLGRELTPGEVSRYWARRAWADVAARPGAWLRLLGRKLLLAVNAVEVVDTEDQYTYADSSATLRLAGYFGHFGVIAPLALLGLWTTWDRRGRLLPIYLMLAAYFLSLIVFYVFARYRYPLVPFLVLLAAAGLVEAPRLVRETPRPRLAAVAASVAIAAVLCNLPLLPKDRMRSMTELSIGEELAIQGRLDAALLHARRATELDPKNAVAFYNLGTMLQSRGELDAAAESFRRTLKIRPDYALAWINLGAVYGARGDTAAAIEHFEAALRSDPGSALAHFNLGIAHQSQGDLRAAARHYREAIALDGDLDAARKALANLERLERKRDGAP